MRRSTTWFAAAFTVGLLLTSVPSSAFVRTTTCSSICLQVCPADGICEDGGEDSAGEACSLGGDCADCGYRGDPSPNATATCWGDDGYTDPVPVAWLRDRIEYVVDSDGYAGIPDLNDVVAAVDASFATWNEVEGSYILVESGGLSEEPVNNVDTINVITFVEEGWEYAPAALAIASVTYSPCGEIVDADIEFNADEWSFRNLGTGPVLATSHDLQNTLTHEIGHLLGFDHCHDDAVVGASNCEEATMRVQTEAGDITMRDLSTDDIAAIVAVYPSGGSPPDSYACPTKRSRKRGCATSANPSTGLALLCLIACAKTRQRPGVA